MSERIVCDEKRPGIELIEFQGESGYQDERLMVSNGLSNGLRIEVLNDYNGDWNSFHIHSPETALLIASRLTEWCERIADPPAVP